MLPNHREAAGLDRTDTRIFLDTLVSAMTPVDVHFLWRPHLPDINDEMILEAAVNGNADVLVTFNIRDYPGVFEKFGIEVLKPAQAVSML